jgi:hypothetical protein
LQPLPRQRSALPIELIVRLENSITDFKPIARVFIVERVTVHALKHVAKVFSFTCVNALLLTFDFALSLSTKLRIRNNKGV